MRRREFITLLGGAATAVWPLAARAQQGAMPVIGFLSNGYRQLDEALRLPPLREGLKEAGYVDGRNVASQYRWAERQNDRLEPLATDLVRQSVALIVAIGGLPPAIAAKRVTTTIPIVFITTGDPVRQGLVASFNQPGGNLSGVSGMAGVVVAKQLEVLHETVPLGALVGLLTNPTNPNVEFYTRDAQEAARALGLKLLVVRAATERDLESAFATLAEQRVDAILVPSDSLFNDVPDQLVALAAHHAMPAVYSLREFPRAGGLMSYGNSLADAYQPAGVQAGRILKGERVADLPVIQATKIELIINLKTAKALGLAFPITLLGRADEVIE
jgi:putative ABC transport system substrate-binding protein